MPKKRKSKKKSYNPFKMWGSWIGLGIGVISMLTPSINSSFFGEGGGGIFGSIVGFLAYPLIAFINNNTGNPIGILLAFIYMPSLGFLIGWGIHSLFRKYSKRRK